MLGKVFIRGNHAIPTDSYIVFFSKSNHSVHKSEDIKEIPDTNEFRFEGQSIDAKVDFDNWTLTIGNNLVSNVRWFSVVEEGDKLRIEREKFTSVERFTKHLSSILTFGILGCLHLKDKHGDLSGIQDSWEQIQGDIPDINTLERLLGDPEYIKDAQSIREGYGQIHQVSLPPEDAEGLEKVKEEFGSWENFYEVLANYKNLKSKMKLLGDTEFNEALKLRDKYLNLSRISKEVEDYQDLKMKYGSLESLTSKLSNYIDPEYKKKLESDNKELQSKLSNSLSQLQKIGTEEDIYSLLSLRRNFGGNFADIFTNLQELRNLKDNYGSVELIKQKLSRLDDLIKLESTIEQQKKELERWQALSEGASIDYLETIKSQKEDKIQEGIELERRIEEILLNLSNNRTLDDIEWKSQHEIGKGRADFLIRLKNKQNKQLTIIVECKRHGGTHEALENISINERDDETAARLLNAGLAQLCEYYKGANAHFGLLVTNARVWGLDKKGIQNISWNIPKEYAGKQMNLLLVHESAFETLMTVIKYINNTLDPDIEVVHTYAEKRAYYNDPHVSKLALMLQQGLNAANKKLNLLKNRLADIHRDAHNAIRYHEQYMELISELHSGIHDFLRESSFYSDNPILERGSVEVVTEDDEGEEEDQQ